MQRQFKNKAWRGRRRQPKLLIATIFARKMMSNDNNRIRSKILWSNFHQMVYDFVQLFNFRVEFAILNSLYIVFFSV